MRAELESAAFAYPGPRPHSKETAILMLAEAVRNTQPIAEHRPAAVGFRMSSGRMAFRYAISAALPFEARVTAPLFISSGDLIADRLLALRDDDGSDDLPAWLGRDDFHRSHQSKLLRKDPAHYGPLFPGVPDDLEDVWPVA